MATKTIEQELLGLEKEYWQAIKDKDVDAAMRLTDDACIVTLEAADASTCVRRDDRWVCALHTDAITGDPFGRDRQTGH